MPSSNFYPAVSEIIPLDSIPISLGPIKEGIQNIFSKIFYKNLIIEKSPFNDTAFYKITLISYDRIGFEIPGNGLKILFNPDDTSTSVTPIDISASYKLVIVKYI